MEKKIYTWLQQDPILQDCLQLYEKKGIHGIYGVAGSQKTLLTAGAIGEHEGPVFIVASGREQAASWYQDLAVFCPERPVYEPPMVDKAVLHAAAQSMDGQAALMELLGRLLQRESCTVLLTPETAAQYVWMPEMVRQAVCTLSLGEKWPRSGLLERLVKDGYERSEKVERRGHFAVRGDIVDIYAVNYEHPVRIEFFGDEIDSIRFFDADTQRSQENAEHIAILPMRLPGEGTTTILSYGNEADIVIWDEPVRAQDQLKAYLKETEDHRRMAGDWRFLSDSGAGKKQLVLSLLSQKTPYLSVREWLTVSARPVAGFQKQFQILEEEIRDWLVRGYAVLLAVADEGKREALAAWLEKEKIPFQDNAQELAGSQVFLWDGNVQEGFEFPQAKLAVVSALNIYGNQKRKLRKKAKKGEEIQYFTDLEIGDYVVHDVHGIGKYCGIKTIESFGIHKDYLEIQYAGKDVLYVPSDQLNVLQKYIGNEGDTPRLHKMGGAEWTRTKSKAKKSIDDLAESLVQIYANREIVKGHAFQPDTPWQREFEDDFPYEETPDQLKAVAEIKESMEQPHPMDRLVCGDVGFGKTEVAIRAVFKAVMDGKQVAVLVPTTVLAQQHYKTFTNRFYNFGVRCDVLNRFRSAGEKKEILERLAQGTCDVLIGTHSLLNKKVKFKDLGLLVVDEEQRFGVAQKEKWKEWAADIDVLTLSATPIPRTLHMSLVGVREMSVIDTPPQDRFPVQTYVTEYAPGTAKDAILRELRRGGQVYFIYNRVASIDKMAESLQAMLPDARIAVAHGQMHGALLEQIMMDFYEGKYDILLCTSLIENGLDVPNANTILIYDADQLGLSQLYQMRGRVGRSHRLAYAYLFYRPDKSLTEVAEKRLQAIREFTELGSGFKIAMRDLEIRGAGNLLGREQHGNIANIGFAMYCQMLEDAIRRLKDGSEYTPPPPDTVLEIHVDAFIDETYISDMTQKIEMYRRLAALKTLDEWSELADEMVDRFGTPTQPVEQLLKAAQLRLRASLLGIVSVVPKQGQLDVKWHDSKPMADWAMEEVSPYYWKRIRFLPVKPLELRVQIDDRKDILSFLDGLLAELEKKTSAKEGAGE